MRTNHIHSSWSCDRIGSCVADKPHKIRATHKQRLCACYKGNEVKVITARGREVFSVTFDSKVVSAVIRDGSLEVQTADDCFRQYDVLTWQLVSEDWTTPPSGGCAASDYFEAA